MVGVKEESDGEDPFRKTIEIRSGGILRWRAGCRRELERASE